MLSILFPSAFSSIIDTHNTHINYDLVYQSNIDVFQNNSLRFSTALQDRYHLFNIDYDYSMYPCFEMCAQIPGCQGIFNLPGTCIGLSYLGEYPQTSILVSDSYRKVVNLSILSNLSCYDRCGIAHHFSGETDKCWCDELCPFFNDCCADYTYYCVDHCQTNNGGCSQLCQTNNFGTVNCDCESGYFLGDDLTTCHPENSIVGRIYDNIHEIHLRNITILVSNSETNFTLNPDFHGEFMMHNLTEGNYTIKQLIHGNCTQMRPNSSEINITVPTNKEYDFYNFCGLNCRCNSNQYLSECNYVTGFGTCHNCDVCADTHHTIQNCTNISNTICELITSTQTSTETSTQTSTETTTQTISDTTTQTISDTSTQSTTPSTTQSMTETTTPTITYKISLNSESQSNASINYQTVTVVLAVLLAVLIILISIFFIKYNNDNRRSNSVTEENQIQNNNINSFASSVNTYDNPVFDVNESNNNTFYNDVDFEEEPTNSNGYMDVAPTQE